VVIVVSYSLRGCENQIKRQILERVNGEFQKVDILRLTRQLPLRAVSKELAAAGYQIEHGQPYVSGDGERR
jgi:hypothetical protein